MKLGEFLKNKRLENNLTLEQVADFVGVPRGTVWKWEKSIITEIGRSNIKKLSLILKINPTIIINWDENSCNDNTIPNSPIPIVAYNGSSNPKKNELIELISNNDIPDDKLSLIKSIVESYIEK